MKEAIKNLSITDTFEEMYKLDEKIAWLEYELKQLKAERFFHERNACVYMEVNLVDTLNIEIAGKIRNIKRNEKKKFNVLKSNREEAIKWFKEQGKSFAELVKEDFDSKQINKPLLDFLADTNTLPNIFSSYAYEEVKITPKPKIDGTDADGDNTEDIIKP